MECLQGGVGGHEIIAFPVVGCRLLARMLETQRRTSRTKVVESAAQVPRRNPPAWSSSPDLSSPGGPIGLDIRESLWHADVI
jgi:hypothetical protein